jgi:hypothetical protein
VGAIFSQIEFPIQTWQEAKLADSPILRWAMVNFYIHTSKISEQTYLVCVANVLNFVAGYIPKLKLLKSPYTLITPMTIPFPEKALDFMKKRDIRMAANKVLAERTAHIVIPSDMTYDEELFHFLKGVVVLTAQNPVIYVLDLAEIIYAFYKVYDGDPTKPVIKNVSLLDLLIRIMELWKKYKTVTVSISFEKRCQKCLGQFNNRYKKDQLELRVCLLCYDITNLYITNAANKARNYTDEFRPDVVYTCLEKSLQHKLIPLIVLDSNDIMYYPTIDVIHNKNVKYTISLISDPKTDSTAHYSLITLVKKTTKKQNGDIEVEYIDYKNSSQQIVYCSSYTLKEACIGCAPTMCDKLDDDDYYEDDDEDEGICEY